MGELVEQKTLVQLMAEAQDMATRLMECEGELTEDAEKALTINEKSLAVKVDNYVLVMEAMADRADYMAAKAKELQVVSRQLKVAREAVKERVKFVMLENELTDLTGQYYRFKISRVKPKYIIDEDQVPEKFKKEVITYKVDRDAVVEQMVEGVEIPGVKVEQGWALRTYNYKGK